MKQHEAVIKVMEENGGYATLGYLYQYAPKVVDSHWGTKTPFATIRRIVQTHKEFFKIQPGLWALTAQHDQVLQKLNLDKGAEPFKVEESKHGFFQGLILEIGNLSHYNTFAPAQDKNRMFLGKKLAEIATLHVFHQFTYPELLQRARTVDVTWFNERRFPSFFFEVENSTDFYNSLLKFVEFQDFKVDFKIVADAVRQLEFESRLKNSAFNPIRGRVKFLSFDSVSNWHTKITEFNLIQQTI